MSNGNQTVGLPPTTSLMLNNNEEARSYSEQSSFNNGSLRIGMKLLMMRHKEKKFY